MSGPADATATSQAIIDYIRRDALARGIDPNVALTVARSEGGTDTPAKRGTFNTGSSWWPFQLHYGGPGYEQFGTVAGLGTQFTQQTGFAPGDPAAWQASIDFALNVVKQSGRDQQLAGYRRHPRLLRRRHHPRAYGAGELARLQAVRDRWRGRS